MLKFATLIAALLATSVFASTAEARGGGVYFSTWLRNAGAKQAHERWVASHPSSRDSGRAAELAAQASAAKRARLLALQRRQAAKQAAAKRARLSSEGKNASTATPVATDIPRTPQPKLADATPKGDLLASATTPTSGAATAALDNSKASPDLCRKYSPAADGLIDVPCK